MGEIHTDLFGGSAHRTVTPGSHAAKLTPAVPATARPPRPNPIELASYRILKPYAEYIHLDVDDENHPNLYMTMLEELKSASDIDSITHNRTDPTIRKIMQALSCVVDPFHELHANTNNDMLMYFGKNYDSTIKDTVITLKKAAHRLANNGVLFDSHELYLSNTIAK